MNKTINPIQEYIKKFSPTKPNYTHYKSYMEDNGYFPVSESKFIKIFKQQIKKGV